MAAVLAGFVLFSLFVGTLPTAAALALCVLAGGALAVFGRHSHGGVLVIDVYARRSRYFGWSPALKTGGCVLLLVLCVASASPWASSIRACSSRRSRILAISSVIPICLLLSWFRSSAGRPCSYCLFRRIHSRPYAAFLTGCRRTSAFA